MSALDGQVTQLIAEVGGVLGGGVAIGSLPGALFGVAHGGGVTKVLEHAGAGGLMGALFGLTALILEELGALP